MAINQCDQGTASLIWSKGAVPRIWTSQLIVRAGGCEKNFKNILSTVTKLLTIYL